MKKISFEAYKAGKKYYTVVCQEKILSPDFGEIFFFSYPPPPPSLKSQMVSSLSIFLYS